MVLLKYVAHCYFWRIALIITSCWIGQYLAKGYSCERGSCSPGTGNLLIGRENHLFASSTCGLNSRERFCVVTNLEDKKKCFWCDSRPQYSQASAPLSHRIENVVPKPYLSQRRQYWWQSENGVENVTIRLDLEAEFHFTHLYMKFKTFRPAAMLVERSYDYGETWKVYRYFAYDCNKYFPNVLKGPHNNLTVEYCDETYSLVTPITDGEVILKILPSTLDTIDPYSNEIQSLVKITNLRINFTKLHTLGDDLLDSRIEIQEKYYYAVWEMVVGGSCSCYGHADRCVPQEGTDSKQNMVHGKCECTHNTKGFNCNQCEDFYNDLEWAPAIGRQKNECKRCNCNNHATSCHHDKAVFEASGRISGGVCDDCLHNTMGRNCEQCKHFFYQDPTKDFSSPDVCLKCDCDPSGSLDDGICDSRNDVVNDLVSGRCHCKANVEGRRCDSCKNGYWNFTESNPYGCQACSCHIYGTYDNQGCNKETGECTCKRNVIGHDCNQCLPEHWGLGESRDGCLPCECDPGGSYDNNCDVISGQCKCRPNISGRACNVPRQGFFAGPLDFMITEAEFAKCHGVCQVDIREPYHDGRDITWTGTGYVRIFPNSVLEFPIGNVHTTMDYYPVIRYFHQIPITHGEKVHMIVERLNGTDPDGVCGNAAYKDDTREILLTEDSDYVNVTPPVCLEAGKMYNVRLEFARSDAHVDMPTASILVDSIVLVPRIESIPFMREQRRRTFEQNRCIDGIYSVIKTDVAEICKQFYYSIGVYVQGEAYPCKCDSMGSFSTLCDASGGHCQCKTNVVGRQCNHCAPGTYGFSPEGCKACDCHSVGALDNFCDVHSGQCKCRPQTYGRVCDQCQPGSWNYPNCQRCICHGHADICDPHTGACIHCGNYTEGHYCDRCLEGYYGDPRLGINIPCRLCPCPGTVEMNHSFAKQCSLNPRTQDVVCQCDNGYAGSRCEVCADNYFGNPDVPGGSCSPCNCSNNIDVVRSGNCNSKTGQCIQCLFNTEGFNCDVCKADYYGDAVHQLCTECSCDLLGTDLQKGPCDRKTGQCPCLPNVTGHSCNQCIENHWKIAKGTGCERCDCDVIGSESDQCNQFDGQCTCKPGFGGRRCDQCQKNYWGNPNIECFACDCNIEGSAVLQCQQNNGTCICIPGVGGQKCDRCSVGYLGTAPNCNPCGECFDNWAIILDGLKDQTKGLINAATEIMKTGATGSYTKEFENMEKMIAEIEQSLQNTTASSQQLESLHQLIENVRSVIAPTKLMTNVSNHVDNITQRITFVSLTLNELKIKGNSLNETAHMFKNNGTMLQEENVEGALNLTRDAYDRSVKIKGQNAMTTSMVFDTERQCKRTEMLIGRQSTQFMQGVDDNEKNLEKLNDYTSELENQIPSLNKQVCDKGGNPCDQLCGGAGCGFCGGLSCENGALKKAENALKFAKDAAKNIHDKETKTGELFRSVTQTMSESKTAFDSAQLTYVVTESARNGSISKSNKTNHIVDSLKNFTTSPKATPSEIRDVASQALKKNIKLQPQQITELAKQINNTISSLTDIPAIIRDTAGDLNKAQMLKKDADFAKSEAASVLDVAERVVLALDEAQKSQNLAKDTIAEANKNILQAKDDLTQILKVSSDGLQESNETLARVTNLQDRLKKLQTDFLKNDRDFQEIEKELNLIATDVDETQKNTFNLNLNYQETIAKLDVHSQNSTAARNIAFALLNRAGQLSANATAKLKELTDSENNFGDQEKQLSSIIGAVQDLTKRMESYFQEIGHKSDFYINCMN